MISLSEKVVSEIPRAFFPIWAGQFVGLFGSRFTFTAITMEVATRNGSTPLTVSILGIGISLPYAIGSLIAGRLADRSSKLNIMMTTDALRICLLGCILILLMSNRSIFLLSLFCAIVSFFSALFDISFQSSLRNFNTESLVPINSRVEMGRSLCEILGPIVAASIFSYFGVLYALAINAALYLLSFGVLFFNRSLYEDWVSQPKKPEPTDYLAGARFIRATPLLRVLYLFTVLFVCGFSLSSNLWMFYGLNVLRISKWNMGFPFTAMGIGGVLASVYGRRIAQMMSPQKILVGSIVFVAVCWFIPSILHPNFYVLPAYCFCLFGNGFGNVLSRIVTATARQKVCPSNIFGQVLAVFSFTGMSILPAGALIGGLLANYFGQRSVFLFSAVLMLLAASSCIHKSIRMLVLKT